VLPVINVPVRQMALRMRKRLQKFLPIVLIALVVQILAPIGACWAAVVAATDPLQGIEICHSDPAANPSQSDQGGQRRGHDGACSMCCAAQAGASFDTPQAIVIATPYRAIARVVWSDHAPDRFGLRIGSNAQARGPPLSM
jgi:disulfide bond formation protein DsbB